MKALKSFVILFICISQKAKADRITDNKAVYYGKIISLNQQSIKLKNPSTNEIRSIPWTNKTAVYFSQVCTDPGYEENSFPIAEAAKCKERKAFHIGFKSGESAYASQVSLSETTLTIMLISSKGEPKLIKLTVAGKNLYTAIDWLSYRTICDNQLPPKTPDIKIEL